MKDIHELANIYAKYYAEKHGLQLYSVETWNYSNTPELVPYKDRQVRVITSGNTQWEYHEKTMTPTYLGKYNYYNCSSVENKEWFSYEKEISETATWTVSASIKVGMEFQLGISFPFVAEGGSKLSTSIEVGSSYSQTKVNKTTFKDNTIISVPAHTHVWGDKQILMGSGTADWVQPCQYIGEVAILYYHDSHSYKSFFFSVPELFIYKLKQEMGKPELYDGYEIIDAAWIKDTKIIANEAGRLDYDYNNSVEVIGHQDSGPCNK
ncbi:MAG: ETX/MTX2 family pore-forming toxin [Enterobacteriaceae bacterium]|jgi:hypothetical protein|nr:ETX/MTX2 family pore-forming toxin [Enterobacteriaceae bacterium]